MAGIKSYTLETVVNRNLYSLDVVQLVLLPTGWQLIDMSKMYCEGSRLRNVKEIIRTMEEDGQICTGMPYT